MSLVSIWSLSSTGTQCSGTSVAPGAGDRVERIGLGERARIHVLDRVERRPLLVVRGDAVEVALHQRAAGEPPGASAACTEATVASSTGNGWAAIPRRSIAGPASVAPVRTSRATASVGRGKGMGAGRELAGRDERGRGALAPRRRPAYVSRLCSTSSQTNSATSSPACAGKASSPNPTSRKGCAKCGGSCSRPTSTSRSPASSSSGWRRRRSARCSSSRCARSSSSSRSCTTSSPPCSASGARGSRSAPCRPRSS